MTWSCKFVAKSQAAAKAKIASLTTGNSPVPGLIAQHMSAQLDRFGEPGEGRVFLVESGGHDARGPGDYSGTARFEISKIDLAE